MDSLEYSDEEAIQHQLIKELNQANKRSLVTNAMLFSLSALF